MRARDPQSQQKFADQLVATLGRGGAMNACRRNMWYGTMEYIRQRAITATPSMCGEVR